MTSNPILQQAACRSARAHMAQLLPELEKISHSLERAGETDQRDRVENLRQAFVGFVSSSASTT